MYENNPESSTKNLLDQIRTAAMQNVSGVSKSNVAMALPPFSALLVRLSNEAAKAHKQNVRIQRWLVRLTIGILALTVALLVFGFIQIKLSNKSIVIIHEHQQNAKINDEPLYTTDKSQVKLGIEAPEDVTINREEVPKED